MRQLLLIGFLIFCICKLTTCAIPGSKCAKNQVVNKLTVYEDGAIEAECGPIPCGTSNEKCIDDQSACKVETDVFSGMRWAKNGQRCDENLYKFIFSLLLRCCSLNVPNKIYVGTDLVTLGSYYTGGEIAKKDMYGKDGTEYDFIVNARTEQNGVRVWVYRIMCPNVEQQQRKADNVQTNQRMNAGKNEAYQPGQKYTNKFSENQDAPVETVSGGQEEPVINPLQYRPPSVNRQRDSPIPARIL